MAVETTAVIAGPYTGTGAADQEFPVPFQTGGADAVSVWLDGVPVDPLLWSFDRDTDGRGTVIATLAGSVYIVSDPSFQQKINFLSQGPFFPSDINPGLDQSAVKDQYLKALIDKVAPANALLPGAGAGKFLGVDANGDPYYANGTGTDEGLRQDLADSTGTGLIGWIAEGVGAVSRVLRQKLFNIYEPEDYGAAGTGLVDDTLPLLRMRDAAGVGGRMRLHKGATYLIDANVDPGHIVYGGLRLMDKQTLELNGATLKALESPEAGYSVLTAFKVHGWRIIGPGRIEGERDVHNVGTGGEYGHGITVWGCDDWSIEGPIEVTNCWGDGIYVGFGYTGPDPSDDDPSDPSVRWKISGPLHIWDVRRNGISIVGAEHFDIGPALIHDVDGTAPYYGIDLEPNDSNYPNRNGHIQGVETYNCQGGLGYVFGNERISFSNCRFVGENFGVLFNAGTVDCHGRDSRLESTTGAQAGGPVRMLNGGSGGIVQSSVQGCAMYGGGFYLIDDDGVSGGDIAFRFNDLHLTNAGAAGFARIGSGTAVFMNNDCTIHAGAGVNGTQFLQLGNGVGYGHNVYRNLGSNTPAAALLGTGPDFGNEYYGNSLPRASGGAKGFITVQGTKVVGERETGWTAGTGTANKGAFAAYAGATMSAGYVQAEAQATNDAARNAAQRIKALEDALRTHGLIN